MDLGSMLFILALALAVGLFVSRPLLAAESHANAGQKLPADSPEPTSRAQLRSDLDQELTAIQELDMDHALGKLPEDDYSQQRSVLAQAGAAVLRRLDALDPDPAEAAQADLSAVAEEPSAASKLLIEQDEIEARIAARRRARQAKISGYCPRCGKPLTLSDQFCPRCGKPVDNKG